MNFLDIFIRRLVLSTVVAFMTLLLGFQGMFNLSVRQYPEVEETAITVYTVYPGSSGDRSCSGNYRKHRYVTSQSILSSKTVTVQMELGYNPDKALTEVMSKV